MCEICIAWPLVVDIVPWCNGNFVPFPSGTLVGRRMRNGRINRNDVMSICIICLKAYHRDPTTFFPVLQPMKKQIGDRICQFHRKYIQGKFLDKDCEYGLWETVREGGERTKGKIDECIFNSSLPTPGGGHSTFFLVGVCHTGFQK